MNGDKATLYWIDKENFSVREVSGFHNNYFGLDEEFNPWEDYLFVSDELAFIKYASFELKTLIEEALESESQDSDVKHRITSLSEQIDDNDNPILVIGKLKR